MQIKDLIKELIDSPIGELKAINPSICLTNWYYRDRHGTKIFLYVLDREDTFSDVFFFYEKSDKDIIMDTSYIPTSSIEDSYVPVSLKFVRDAALSYYGIPISFGVICYKHLKIPIE